jgi:hypothetical protein
VQTRPIEIGATASSRFQRSPELWNLNVDEEQTVLIDNWYSDDAVRAERTRLEVIRYKNNPFGENDGETVAENDVNQGYSELEATLVPYEHFDTAEPIPTDFAILVLPSERARDEAAEYEIQVVHVSE